LHGHEGAGRALTPTRLLTVLLAAVAIILVPLLYANLLLSALDDLDKQEWGGADFSAYYTAARLITQGTSPYDEQAFWGLRKSFGFRDDRPYIYFPLLAIAIAPLTLLTPPQATSLWFFLNLGLLALSAALLIHTVGLQHNKLISVAFLLAALTFYPAVFSIFVGQANLVLLVLLVAVWRFLRRGHQARAGIAIAAASLVKIFPLTIAAYLLWKRRYRAFVWTLVALTCLVAISVTIVGVQTHLTYLSSVLPSQFFKPHPLNQSIWASLARALPLASATDVHAWRLAGLSASALVIVATILLVPPRASGSRLFDLEFSLILVSTLLVSSVSWVGTLTLLLLPYGALVGTIMSTGGPKYPRVTATLMVASFILVNSQRVVEAYATTESAVAIPPYLLSLPLCGMLLLWIALACSLWTGPGRPLPGASALDSLR
jgi:hypothetical protein